MKSISKYISSAVMFVAAALAFTSCDDWTEPKHIDLDYGTIDNADPAAYEKYLANLRAYRGEPHKHVYAWFNNIDKAFGSQGHRVSALPDSTDVIVINNPEKVTNQMIQEMYEARVNKGQQFSYCVSFDAIKSDYTALCEELAAKRIAYINEHGEDAQIPEELLDPDFIEYLAESTSYKLTFFNTVGFDCIMAAFDGKSTLHMTPVELAEYKTQANAFLGLIVDWLSRNSEVKLDLLGKPQNVGTDVLSKVRYSFFSQSAGATNKDQYTLFMLEAGNALPEAQYGMVAYIPDASGADAKLGYYTNGGLAVNGLAEWTATNPVGAVGILNASDDYFLTTGHYTDIRNLIQTVNPSAK